MCREKRKETDRGSWSVYSNRSTGMINDRKVISLNSKRFSSQVVWRGVERERGSSTKERALFDL